MTAGRSGVFVHPLGLCESDDVGVGTRIWAFAHVMPGAKVGAGCNVCDHVYIEGGAVLGDGVTVKNNSLIFDGVTIEDDVFVGPNTVFTNDRSPRAPALRDGGTWAMVPTRVRRGASIGANSVIVCGSAVGAYAVVGAGSVVTRAVPDFAVVAGNPARPIGWACICGGRLGEGLSCRCGRRFELEADNRLRLAIP